MTWRERIIEARAHGMFTDDDKCAAGQWATCAVGEQHAALPLVVLYDNSLHCPKDWELAELGSHGLRDGGGFCAAVMRHDFDLADSLLDAIEDRVLVLKRGFSEPEGRRPPAPPGEGD